MLRGPLASLEASPNDLALLDRALLQLDELFLLVIVGEFNSGKSAFINALLGERVPAEGVTPTTAQIHLLKYGDEAGQRPAEHDMLVVTYPVEWLRDINIVDTPGTNAVIRRHQEITEDFVPRADLVLFVTSADRPFSESERAFIERIREWGKKVVFVVNKIDILETPADIDARDRVRRRQCPRACSAARRPSSPCPAGRRGRPRRRSTPTSGRASGPPAGSSRWRATSSARWMSASGCG